MVDPLAPTGRFLCWRVGSFDAWTKIPLLDSVGGLGIGANRFLVLRSFYLLDMDMDIRYSRWILCYLFGLRFELIGFGFH